MEYQATDNRQKDFAWFSKQDILIIGLGGIGSFLSFALARINHNLYLYDMDTFESHNIGGQLVRPNDIGSKKTSVMKNIIQQFNSSSNISTFDKYDEFSTTMPHTMLALDNMEVRKLAVEKWYKSYFENGMPKVGLTPILIDGRLEGEQGIIYTLTSARDYDRWMSEWFPSDSIEDGQCTMRATTYNGMMISANMTAIYNNFIANVKTGDDIREVPFKLEYGFAGLIYDIIR